MKDYYIMMLFTEMGQRKVYFLGLIEKIGHNHHQSPLANAFGDLVQCVGDKVVSAGFRACRPLRRLLR